MSRRLRTVSTARLFAAISLALVVAAAVAAIAVAASRSSSPPPPKPTAQAIHDSLAGAPVDGVTGDVTFTNNLLPTGAIVGNTGSALMSGASGRIWVTNDGRGRIELQSDSGDTQIVWSTTKVTIYDSSSSTAYEYTLPGRSSPSGADTHSVPTVDAITEALAQAGMHIALGDAQPTVVANQPAYSLQASPKESGGLLDHVELAWDANHAIPLRVGIYAKGVSAPVLELKATDISYGAVGAGDVDVAPPASAKVVDLNGALSHGSGAKSKPVTGLAAVQAAAGFTVAAPDALGALARSDVRLVGGDTALVVYGSGPGAIVVAERKADTAGPGGSVLASLPVVTLDGVAVHELATPLGTALAWQANGVAYTLAGSVTQAAAETALKQLP